MVSYPSINLVDVVVDEIALEGLDGITIEALWKRLANRLHCVLPLPNALMVQVWSLCVQITDIVFYELENARELLMIFDRYQYVDPDLGIILEPENIPKDLYPHFPIYDAANDIKGSCINYYTRKDITGYVRKLSLDRATKKYGQKLTIVASQSSRNRALMGDEVPPTIELNVIQYCFLERVGRARYHGEVTQGKLSLNALKEDPKSLFYHRKFLLRHKLITKQIHHQKNGGHSCNGSLLHLPRFFVERKPKIIFLAEEVVKILKSKPNYIAEYDEIRRKLQIENAIKKLFKTSFFQKVVTADVRVPYRILYPNATPAEWQQKNNPTKEKNIKVVQLLFPNIDILEAWNKEEIQEEDESQDINIANHTYCVPYLKQANTVVEAYCSDGVCQGNFSKKMGLTKLQSRTILRNLVKTNIIATYMNDIGRQRLTKYVSKKYEKGSKLSKQFKKEMHKIKELTKQMVNECCTVKNIVPIADIQVDETEEATDMHMSTMINQEVENPNPEIEKEKNVIKKDIRNLFYVVNRLFYKYHITKHRHRYKCTFSNYVVHATSKRQAEEKGQNSKNALLHIPQLVKNEKVSAAYKNIKVKLAVLENERAKKSENEIYGFMEDVQNSERKVTNVTYRLLRRANMIIESVKEHQIVGDMTKLMKMINEEEDKEGYDVKIDKKSLIRLLQKLSKDKLIRTIRITLNGNSKEKHLTFICDPSINIDSPVIQSAVEQEKMKFYLLTSEKFKSSSKRLAENFEKAKSNIHNNVDVTENVQHTSSFKYSTTLLGQSMYGPRISRKYGYSPKFIRMQALHIFLFYLVYEHPGEQSASKAEQIKALKDNDFNISEELAQEFSTIYVNHIGWRMFVPPLPKYNGWPQGWALMCDVLLRLPLSIFLKIHYLSYSTPEIDKYVNHPIRKYYLVKDLPMDIRNSLFYARKYIFHIHGIVTRLCYIGLVQFGPQKLKEKDQVFIYVNRHTELLDTTSSTPNYHMIEDKPYPVTRYYFNEMQAVEKYWYDMWNTCINTPLGGRLVVQGKDIVLEELTKKSDMVKAVIARSSEEAVKLDTGRVPGDRRGAAGIDSACFAHLKRNWNWGFASSTVQQKKKLRNVAYERDTYLSKIKAKPIRFTEFSGLRTVSGPSCLNAVELRNKVQEKNDEDTNQLKYKMLTYKRNIKQKSYVRRVLPRKCHKRKRIKYDEIDYRALQRMHKLRVDWAPHEDKILLVCKVAMVYICPNPRKQVIPFSTIRDILRMYSYTSYNKTSKACQRRLLYILRQERNMNTVALGVEELKQNFFLKRRFGGILEKLKVEYTNFHEYEKRVIEAFKSLVSYVAKKYYDISDTGSKEPLAIPLTVQEFNLYYKVVHPIKPFYDRGFTKDVRNINDIHYAVLNSVIHSSMCCGKDRRSWAYQLFKIYQQYPEVLLRSAMAKIRNDQMVTIKKDHLTTIRKYGNCMPMSSSQYQLSSNYIYKFHTKWPYDIFKESYDAFSKLCNWYCNTHVERENIECNNTFTGIELLPVTGGLVGTIHDCMLRNQIDFDIEIPNQVIMLDPRLKEKDETYFRIAQRYQDVLVRLDRLTFSKKTSSQNTEILNPAEHNIVVDSMHNDTTNVDDKPNMDQYSHVDERKETYLREHDDVQINAEVIKHWTLCDEQSLDSEEESDENINEQDFIKFSDIGRTVLRKDDHEQSAPCQDNSTIETDGDQVISNQQSQPKRAHTSSHSMPLTHLAGNKHEYDTLDAEEHQSNTYSNINLSTQTGFYTPKNKRQRSYDETDNSHMPIQKKQKLLHNAKGIETSANENKEILDSNISLTKEFLEKEIRIIENFSNAIAENKNAETNNKTNVSKINCDNVTLLQTKKRKEIFTRVSDILKNTSLEQNFISSHCKIDDSDVHKRYTRIALLRMQEELSELTVADSHHAHEYFVVNMFKIFYSLCPLNKQNTDKNNKLKNQSSLLDLQLLSSEVVNNLIQKINKFGVFPNEGVSYLDFKKNIEKDYFLNINKLEDVYNFIHKKKEFGASIQELMDEFEHIFEQELHSILSVLTENRLLLRTGVTKVRYIHHYYTEPWLIRSCKIYRIESESFAQIPKGAVYVTQSRKISSNFHEANMLKESQTNINLPLQKDTSKIGSKSVTDVENLLKTTENNIDSDKGTSNESDSDWSTQIEKQTSRTRSRLIAQKHVSKNIKGLDLNKKQEIRVNIKPWIRVDGILNRRVLDRMLGSVLSYCLTHPGVALNKVQDRFIPPLQPCHTQELVEILVKLECLEIIILKKSPITLLSSPAPVEPRIMNNDWAVEDSVYLEPTNDAILKFGIFLSSKMYRTDFIR